MLAFAPASPSGARNSRILEAETAYLPRSAEGETVERRRLKARALLRSIDDFLIANITGFANQVQRRGG